MVELSTTSSGTKRLRTSAYIQRKPLGNLYHAPRMAEAAGTPLNTFVTINFAHTTCPAQRAGDLFERLRNSHFGPWIRRPPRHLGRARDPSAYAWVLENPGTINAHWMVHLPADRARGFKQQVEKWLRAGGIEIKSDFAVHVEPTTTAIPRVYYLMKGGNPAYAQFYGIKRIEAQGPIVGKRSGVSRSLGPTRKANMRAAGTYRRTQKRSLEGLRL